ncbi:MAG: VOC family protein [Bacteroidales bacterium]|jgi:catechol 2,3-dioxygenase-like lactoylglutathione lyase family enzyme|nr:VOC family protein [Bacteroidales bacterium]
MKLHHLALTIQSANEVSLFYEQLLDFKLIREFKLESDLAYKIFNINKSVQVFYLEGHNLALELFIHKTPKQDNYNHWCLSFPDREAFIKKAQEQNATIIRIPRGTHDILFIKDGSGNIFEIKEE